MRKSIGERTREIQSRWEELNLASTAKWPSQQEFIAKWTEANSEQAEGRFVRVKDNEQHIERGYN